MERVSLDGGIYDEAWERERERERERSWLMWSVGAKDRPRVFWGLCLCVRTLWEPRPLGLLFCVGPPIDNMDPLFSLSWVAIILQVLFYFQYTLMFWIDQYLHYYVCSSTLMEYCLGDFGTSLNFKGHLS